MKIAIIGGGISGLSAAYLVHEKHDVTLFERNEYIGGHAHAIDIDYHGTPITLDTSVMIFNPPGYPNFETLLGRIDITEADRRVSDITWGVSFDNAQLEYSNLPPVFKWHNMVSPRIWGIAYHYRQFLARAKRALVDNKETLENSTFGAFMRELKVSQDCIDHMITPLYGCIFSLTPSEILAASTADILGFLEKQHLLGMGLMRKKTTWYTVRGGTEEYLRRLAAPVQSSIRLSTSVKSVRRTDGGVVVVRTDGTEEAFDTVVFATHAPEALALLESPTPDEQRLLGAFTYTKSTKFIVHNDPSVMPTRKAAWAAFTCNDRLPVLNGGLAYTYWINLIQHIDHAHPLFLTINTEAVSKERRFAELEYSHLKFTAASYQAKKELHRLQGVGGIYYCGSYFGFALHEDALNSSIAVARLLGVDIPWTHS